MSICSRSESCTIQISSISTVPPLSASIMLKILMPRAVSSSVSCDRRRQARQHTGGSGPNAAPMARSPGRERHRALRTAWTMTRWWSGRVHAVSETNQGQRSVCHDMSDEGAAMTHRHLGVCCVVAHRFQVTWDPGTLEPACNHFPMHFAVLWLIFSARGPAAWRNLRVSHRL